MAATVPRRVRIVEVGPRDGLQNERAALRTEDKAAFIDLLASAGLPVLEVSAFVDPSRVPRMADAVELFRRIERRPGVKYTALVPNMKGLERAMDAGADEVAIFAAASETFSRRNLNQGVEESLAAYRRVCAAAAEAGLRVRGYLSTCFGCPYEGPVPASRVVDLSSRLLQLGVYEVAVSDTIGTAHPGQVTALLDQLGSRLETQTIALHFHDTRGMALANVLAALPFGISCFDSSAGGLGGCPFAPGASGNVATEDLVYMLDGMGIETGVRLEAVIQASQFIAAHIDHDLPSRVYQAALRVRGAPAMDNTNGGS